MIVAICTVVFSTRAAASGATGRRYTYGHTSALGSSVPAALCNRTPSDRALFDRETPVSIGFMTPTSTPRWIKRVTSAEATSVFPTLVSVAVIKTPRELESVASCLARRIIDFWWKPEPCSPQDDPKTRQQGRSRRKHRRRTLW